MSQGFTNQNTNAFDSDSFEIGSDGNVYPVNIGAYVYLSGAQSLDSATVTTIAFDTEVYDYGADFNTATYTFTCPVAGDYAVEAHLRFGNTLVDQKALRVYIYADAVEKGETLNQTSGTADHDVHIYKEFHCAAGDGLLIKGRHDVGVNGKTISANLNQSWASFRLIKKDTP